MKLHTEIVVTPRYSNEYECDTSMKTIKDMLYNVVIGQEIKILCEGKYILTKVVGVSDSVCEDAIYRYVEVVAINTNV